MAALMRLHREETYERITTSSSPEEIIRAESARRTFVGILVGMCLLYLPIPSLGWGVFISEPATVGFL